jgi:hypothetical protein
MSGQRVTNGLPKSENRIYKLITTTKEAVFLIKNDTGELEPGIMKVGTELVITKDSVDTSATGSDPAIATLAPPILEARIRSKPFTIGYISQYDTDYGELHIIGNVFKVWMRSNPRVTGYVSEYDLDARSNPFEDRPLPLWARYKEIPGLGEIQTRPYEHPKRNVSIDTNPWTSLMGTIDTYHRKEIRKARNYNSPKDPYSVTIYYVSKEAKSGEFWTGQTGTWVSLGRLRATKQGQIFYFNFYGVPAASTPAPKDLHVDFGVEDPATGEIYSICQNPQRVFQGLGFETPEPTWGHGAQLYAMPFFGK